MVCSSQCRLIGEIESTGSEHLSCQVNNSLPEAPPSPTTQPFHNRPRAGEQEVGRTRGKNEVQSYRQGYLLFQEVLLGSNDRAWSANSDPSNDFSMCKPVMLHDVTGYQGPGSSQTSCGKGNRRNAQCSNCSHKNRGMPLSAGF